MQITSVFATQPRGASNPFPNHPAEIIQRRRVYLLQSRANKRKVSFVMEKKQNNRKISMLLDRQWFDAERQEVAQRAAELGLSVTNYLRSLVRADLVKGHPRRDYPNFFPALRQGNPQMREEKKPAKRRKQ